ncbi:MAG: CPBP family intramembrane metalloprotease [Ignavibacteriaceae bacterium]|nr:CPBP family intramembrane metalloprotease [Ignavibacteriaceae bacterium]
MKNFKEEISSLVSIIKSLDRKVVSVLIVVAIVQTISFYFTSRYFFRVNIAQHIQVTEFSRFYEFAYWFMGDFTSFFLIPAAVVKLYLKENLKDFGFTFGDFKTGFKYTGIFAGFMFPIIWFVSSSPEFAIFYPHYEKARESWGIFALYESGIFIYMFAWEFIWRGFLLFGLFPKFGYYAVLIQMIPFVILHNGKPALETFSSILGGIALGILSLRTKSFLYAVFIHFLVMFSIDLLSTLRFRAGDYGIGLSSFINVISKIF